MRIAAFLLLILGVVSAQSATSYTEFYVQTTGKNTNSGTTTSDTAVYSSIHGDWDGTSVFTVHDGSNPTVSVQTNTFAAVFVDGGSVPAFLGRIEGTNATTITLSTTAKVGSLATQTGTATLTWGGAWKGPNAAVAFPFGTSGAAVGGVLTNASQNITRINFKTGSYSVSGSMTHSIAGPIVFEGYTTTVDDGGMATITGSGNTALLSLSSGGSDCEFRGFIFGNNAGTGAGFISSGSGTTLYRCVAHDIPGSGFSFSGNSYFVSECEAYACNTANTANVGAFHAASQGMFWRCNAHDNTQANAIGFFANGAIVLNRCISDSNGGNGFALTNVANRSLVMWQCDAYKNGGNGADLLNVSAAQVDIENCNFVQNTLAGIASTGSLILRHGRILNCGFGSGTATNSGGSIAAIEGVNVLNSVLYPADTLPWVDGPNGNFGINLPQARGVGAGSFTETATSYSGTVAYPDIGSGQSISRGSAAVFAQ